MPTITFVTPPGRPSVLRTHTIQEAKAEHADASANLDTRPATTVLRHHNSETVPDADQVTELVPLTFEKRVLNQLTTSPEPVTETFDLTPPPPRISLDEASSYRTEIHKPSLLSTALVASSAHPPRSASTTNLGILRKAASEDSRNSLDGIVRGTGDATDTAPSAAPRPRLHFVEPHKQTPLHTNDRQDAMPGMDALTESSAATPAHTLEPSIAATSTTATSAVTVTTAVAATLATGGAAKPTTSAEPAPRKRSLVIQEHADVIERAAERAARQANHLSSQALEQHTPAGISARSRQHSASSAGDETASTRSSWAHRSNSRGSSVATSPSIVSEDHAQEPTELDLAKPLERPPLVVPIFSNAISDERADSRLHPAPTTSSRKLTFISPAPSKRRRSPEVDSVQSTRRAPDQNVASSSRAPKVVSDAEEQIHGDNARRVLAFAACPKPERAARLSPAHATRKPKSKLSASPAPHKLAYPQRLRGIRGTDPIRSPAPDKAVLPSAQAARWNQHLDGFSSEGSGYSEDEEDGESYQDDDDEEDILTDSNASDVQSQAESLLEESQDSQTLHDEYASPSPADEVEEVLQEEIGSRMQGKRSPDWNAHSARSALDVLSDFQPANNRQRSSRRSSSSTQGQPAAANPTLAGQTSPPRLSQSSQSTQASPRSGLPNRSMLKLKPKDSFSHPMCFLPDAFEESAPPTPTEADSDAYETPQRANLLSGWLSEGASAASSRRASWQQSQPQHPAPTSPLLRSGDESGSAVPISLPPFRRTRERTAPQSVTSDGEHSSRSLGGNAAFIRESAGLNAGASPHVSPSPVSLGISVPVNGRPPQPVSWRHMSSQHVPVMGRPSTAVAAFRRASHSMEPRKVSSAVTSPIASYSHVHATGRATPVSNGGGGGASVERPVRASTGKQRAVSSSSHIRSRPLVAQSMHDDVVVATSPPRHNASTQLKHHLAHSPKSPMQHASGSTTPGWISDGQLPSQTTSRYWTERLSSLAQAMSEELTIVGNAVLGKDKGAEEEGEGGERHQRSKSVPLEGAVSVEPQDEAEPPSSVAAWAPRRNSASIPVPAKSLVDAWTAERDGQTQLPQRPRTRQRPPAHEESDAEGSSSADEAIPFQFAKKEVGADGTTRLVVIHTSDTREN